MQKRIKQAQKYLEWQKPDQAIAELRSALKNNGSIQKEYAWLPNHMMGIALSLKGNHESSAGYLEKAVKQGSEQPETFHMLSVNFYNLGQFEKAEKYAEEAIERKDDFLKAWLNLGSVYRSQAKLDEALHCYKKANELDSSNAGVAFRIGEIYRDQGDLDQAMKLFDITLEIENDHIRAMLEKADIYKKKGNLDEALENLEKAHKTHGNRIPIQVSKAEIYKSQGDYDKAISLYESLLEKQPERGSLRINYALCLQEVSRFDQSEKHYRQAIEDMKDPQYAISNYLMGLHYNPQNSKEYIFNEHVRLGKEFIPEGSQGRAVPSDKSENKRLKVGFVSGGFRRHPVGWMIAGALEQLPADEFELYCYTTNNKFDFVTRRIHQNIDTWRSIVGYSADVVEKLIREDELDILVDLSGHAADNCLEVMANEPAPIIVKWVGGLFNTTGLEAFDYLITDGYESPEGDEQYYTEKLVRLPDDYIIFTPPAYAPDIEEQPAKKNGYITFGCFNNPTKVNEQVLCHWARIMREVPESRLYLKSKQYDTASFREQILQVMREEGIAEDRIKFKGQTSHDDHLGAYNKVDIALDPWPYSGGLTTCEALYMGVPVITMPGPTFAGRHSTTHLMNAGLEQWITDSWQEYTEKTVALANDLDKLEAWRYKLRDQLFNSPVCDGKRFGAHLSVAFREMWKQWIDSYENESEEWADHIRIEPLSEEMIAEMTDGPEITPAITIKDYGATNGFPTEDDYETKQEKVDEQNMEESLINVEELGQNTRISQNGTSSQDTNHRLNGFSQNMTKEQDKECFIETKDGVTICVPRDINILTTYVLLEQEEWFEPELKFVRELVKPGMHITDVGAGFGAYSLPMASKVGDKGKVYAFEPVSDTRNYLERSKVENSLNQLEIYVHGLAEETRRAGIKKAETPELNTLTQGDDEIPLSTLDKWWGFIGQPDIDLIKIDVNGMEPQVLEGGQSMLSAISPVVIVSIGDADSLQDVRNQFKNINYALYEYIPGPGLLAEHDPEAGVDPYLMNVVAIPESRIEEFKENGWIFDESIGVEATDLHRWKGCIDEMPWAKSQLEQWEEQIDEEKHKEYLEALNLICTAEQINVRDSDDPSVRSRKGAMMLKAAHILIGLFNNGKAGISAALTYVRVMSQLGKRSQAVEMMKQLMETVNSGKDISVELPFLPPLSEQDNTDIQTDFSKWLTVRVVEAWITLKNPSMYMADEQDRKMLEALEGNPEVNTMIKKVIRLSDESTNAIATLNNEEDESLSAGNAPVNGHAADSSALKHLYLGYPGKQGGAHGIHEIRARKLAQEIRKKGISASVISSSKPEFLEALSSVKNNPGYACYSGVMGYDLKVHSDMGVTGNVFDLMDITGFAFLGDHPYTEFMWNRIINSADNMVFLTPISSLKEEMEEIFPNISVKKIGNLFPLSENAGNLQQIKDRPIDVLIPWGLHKFFANQQSLEECLQGIGSKQRDLGLALYNEAVDNYEKSILAIFSEIYQAKFGKKHQFGGTKTKDDFRWLKVLSLVDWTIRKDRRIRMLKEQLSTLPDSYRVVVTAQKQLSELIPELKGKNIEWIGEVSKEKLNQLYRSSKIALNCNPTYLDNIHPRIYEGMNNGCFIVSDFNQGLEKTFWDADAIGIVGGTKNSNSLADYVAADWSSLQEKVERGQKIIQTDFTAEKHAESIIEVITKEMK